MRYIILNSSIDVKEVNYRQKYIHDICSLFTTSKKFDKGIELISMPPSSLDDIIFIIGHNDNVFDYITSYDIAEKNIVIISCNIGKLATLVLDKKNIFTSSSLNTSTKAYPGKKWGFHFEITEPELNLYNSKKANLIEKIKENFERKIKDG